MDVLTVLLQLIAALIGVILSVIGWLGSRMIHRMDELAKLLTLLERDLRKDLSMLDRRVVKIESIIEED